MVDRVRKPSTGGNYFAAPKRDIEFIPTGCKVLDLALGGGWAEGRIGNIVGDKSTGKTLLCIEAAANFALKYPKGRILYREAEAAFDEKYAAALGMPMSQVDFGKDVPLETVEDLFEDLEATIKEVKQPTFYVCDSLDALSDRAEMDRDMDAGTYGAEKAKKLSQLFRRLTRRMANSKVTLLIVSQVRSKIGTVSFGRTTTRSGGRALDFYASQVLYLSQTGTISKTVSGIKRPTGVHIKAKVDKNKISLPYREAAFDISFGFGINDLLASLDFLKEAGSLKMIGISDRELKEYINETNKADNETYFARLGEINEAVEQKWYEIETSFMPKRQKYGREYDK